MTHHERPRTDVSQQTMPAAFYTDPNFFRREVERIHSELWLLAGRADEAPRPGDYVVREFADANLIVLRDERGDLRAFHNVCRHRGTRLCDEPSGHLTGRLVCPYHAWSYRLDGTLAHAPHMDQVDGFREADWPLRPVAVGLWGRLLFVNLSPAPMPFADYLAGLDATFRGWRLDRLECVAQRRYELKANWKLVIQNYSECLHCPVAHPQLTPLSHYLSGRNEPPRPTFLGSRMDLREGMTTMTTTGKTARRLLPDLTDEQRRCVYFYALLPNTLLSLHPDYAVTYRMNPAAVDRTEIVCEWLMDPDEIARPGFDPSDAVEFWDLTNRQDWALSDRAQAGIASRGYVRGPYSNREEMLWAFDRWVQARAGVP
jgi:Rieske 2Fe-2S family protein